MGLFRKSERQIEALSTIQDTNTFKLVKKLAEGGMGAVYEAIQLGAEGFEKRMAIKTILEDFSTNDEFVEMFIGEAKLVADLIHQHIVQIYQLGKAGRQYYMAMEFIKGVNLEQFIDRHHQYKKRIPTELCVYICSRVCRALEYAHKKRNLAGELLGVVHRDVSPKNIMIDTEGVVKLTDFGIAKARNLMKDKEGDVLMGKVQYMSPEQAAFEQTDGRSDIFSLGVVLYELLAGRNIFADDDTLVCIENVQKKPIPPISHYNPNVDDDLQRVLDRMLERDKSKRYQDGGEAATDLEFYIYKGGYGPTFSTLSEYLLHLFPEFKQRVAN
ncbi:MAG: Serine/threonine-protein kinase pkn6 [Planctomycetes bacterium]|nr:Serine/threonine-protein kinase pkn6 [Planctomycetota bacterium]MCZ7605193.1 serine/threonine protein kinase [Planctomycetota bacterium]